MTRLAIFASLLAGASTVFSTALPLISRGCDVTAAKPDLPSGQTNVTIPAGQTTQTITLGVGVQNYTCSDAGTYTSIGAVAKLFDVSCLYGHVDFPTVTEAAYDVWNAIPDTQIAEIVEYYTEKGFPVYADHYFGPSPSGSGISPVFDARATSHKGDPNAYVLASKTGDLIAPTGKQDVDWLQLTNVQGDLAKTVLRVDTNYGQPPSSCTPGSGTISVKYTASYYFLS